jgi:hypothetical protein
MPLAGIALRGAAYAASIAVTAALFAHVVAGNAEIQGCWLRLYQEVCSRGSSD